MKRLKMQEIKKYMEVTTEERFKIIIDRLFIAKREYFDNNDRAKELIVSTITELEAMIRAYK